MTVSGVRLAVVVGLAVLASGLAACVGPKPAAKKDPSALVKPTYEILLRNDNDAIRAGEASTKGPIDSAPTALGLVGVYNERARMTGDYEDYARAEALLDRMEPRFKTEDGFCLARAKMHYTLHRLAAAKAVLDACPRLAGRAEDLALRADLAFYSGRYKDAGVIYRALVNQLGAPQTYTGLSLYSAKMGAPGEALAFMEAAEKRYHGAEALQESWFALQRGLVELDRGNYEEARALFALADERLPGYWLNDEHMAEVTRLMGDTAKAKAIYERVVKATGAPEYLDALGGIEAEQGNAAAAKALFAKAEAIYDARARRFPEAIAGHALEHYLKFAPQPAKALTLAEANFKNRPYGDAAIALAKAYLLNNRPRDAVQVLDRELAKGWDTAETYWILSLAAQAAGDPAKSATAAKAAQHRNPHAATQYAFVA